ncbi:hypothetical protein ASPCAL02936 [Aspergillus calidoustus]|uniref:BZIP domain-containing protein n=1 Tax=Aspergillus calidoustus TaxID=454130 RepID=A0A0U5GN03_ASPCI|nr:hypothetical protein ASPCAL02936 [Aspergillus calidoustus]
MYTMDTEQYPLWPIQSPTPSELPPGIAKNVDMSFDSTLQCIYGMFPDAPSTEDDLDTFLYQDMISHSSNLQENEALLPVGLSPSGSEPSASTISSSLSPQPVERSSARSSPAPRHDKLAIDDRSYSMKRRMQNREAQRRFRERKEEHLTTLEKRAAIAEERYKELLKDTEQQTAEAAKLRTENKRLKAETHRLRERWRTMLALLQPAQRLIALSVLLAGNTQDDELEDFMRSLKG